MPDYFSMLTQAILGTSSYLDSSNSPSTEPFIPTNNTHGFLTTTGFTNPTWSYSYGGNAICVSGTISISAVATNAKILWDGPKNNFELTEWLTDFMRLDSTLFGRMFGGEQTISDTFDIFGKLCAPATTDMSNTTSGSEVPDTIQILTHGGALDSTYWDFYPNHSYIDFAASRGHYTFSYDRLGSGRSQHPNPIQVVQIPLQVEILHDLVSQLRAGSFSDVQFKRVVGVGHSLGAALTQRVAGKYGEDFDAVVVMGHSGFHGGSAVGFAGLAQRIANTIPGEKGEEGRFKGLPNGYFTFPPLAQCAQWAFFYYPYFEESGMYLLDSSSSHLSVPLPLSLSLSLSLALAGQNYAQAPVSSFPPFRFLPTPTPYNPFHRLSFLSWGTESVVLYLTPQIPNSKFRILI
jgi:pimeloyl-ACP methyl ester carboxylesterase